MSRVALLWPELVSYLDTQAEPHILLDLECRVLAANRAYRHHAGDGRDVVGRKCHEISHGYPVPCDRMGEACPRERCLASGHRERAVHLHHTPHGDRYERIDVSPVRDGQGAVVGFVECLAPLVRAHRERGRAVLACSRAK